MSYVSIHNHTDIGSNGRLKDSIIKTSDMIDYANELGLNGLAITDHESVSAHIKAIKHVKKLKESGKMSKDFKLILGNEIYLVERDSVVEGRENNERIDFYHLILLAKSKKGHEALRILSSKAWKDSFHFKGLERVPTYWDNLEEIMLEYKGEIIASSACLGGQLAKLSKKYIDSNDIEDKKQIHIFIKRMLNIFGDDFYIELQPSHQEEQIEMNKFLLTIAKAYKIKAVISTDSHYKIKEHKIFHHYFLQSKDGDRETDDFYSSTYMMSEAEIREYIKDYIIEEDIIDLFANTNEIGSKIVNYDLYQDVTIPLANIHKFKLKHLFSMYYDKYPNIKKYAYSEHEIDRFFLSLIEEGFLAKKQIINKESLERIEEELWSWWEISEKMKQQMSGYYVLTKEIIDEMWLYSYVGIARGSAAGSYCCYLLGITQINPIEFNLPFFRHIHPSRVDMPDIDIDTETTQRENIIEHMKNKYGHDKIINLCTFKMERAKSSVFSACKGIGLDTDTIEHIKKLAIHPTLSDCLYGNAEEGLKPLKDFIEEIHKYENLEEAILLFEGLVSGRGCHASGVIKYDKGIINHNAIMTTNGGIYVTQFDYEDSCYCGAMKLDFLSINALTKIRHCMDLLIENKKIEPCATIRETYNKYIHPDVIDWHNPKLFELLTDGKVMDAFQFMTSQGQKALSKLAPIKNYYELVAGNSLMRLSVQGDVQPIDKFVSYKNDISLAYKQMREEYQLNEDEISTLESLLKDSYFVADTQELAMMLSMSDKIANFTVEESNQLRKSIAKVKAKDQLKEIKNKFYLKGQESGNRKNILDYVWIEQITPMLGYSFSKLHVVSYTAILMQELNLCLKYGTIFWSTSVLSETIGDNGSVACGVGNLKSMVINPDINLSHREFAPYEKENKILYGLLSIDGIGKDVVNNIINNRPYKSIDDVFEKLLNPKHISILNLFTLAKSGALDNIYDGSRKELMIYLVKRLTPKKNKLTMQNISKIANYLPEHLSVEKKLYWFRNVFLKKCKKDENTIYATIDSIDFINSNFTFKYNLSEYVEINIKDFEKYYKKNIIKVKTWLESEEALGLHHRIMCRELWNTHCSGNFASWEMDTIYFYTKKHELADYGLEKMFNISNFNELSEIPILERVETTKKGIKYNVFKTSTIAGTVVHKNKDKNIVYILTEDGVVPIKFYKNSYKKYDNKVVESCGKSKTILSDTFFKRGTKLVVSGYRKLDEFIPKTYNFNSSPVIKCYKNNGELKLEYKD